jgi:hypothetical protein
MSFPKHIVISDCGTICTCVVVNSQAEMDELERMFFDDYGMDEVRITSFREARQDYLELVEDMDEIFPVENDRAV